MAHPPVCQGIIPRAVQQLFDEIDQRKLADPAWSCRVSVSFLEIYNEEFKDLLDAPPPGANCGANSGRGRMETAGSRSSISLREGPNGSIQVVGAREEPVESYEDVLRCLARGSSWRSVGATAMNSVSSRSHAIVTVSIEQSVPLLDALSYYGGEASSAMGREREREQAPGPLESPSKFGSPSRFGKPNLGFPSPRYPCQKSPVKEAHDNQKRPADADTCPSHATSPPP